MEMTTHLALEYDRLADKFARWRPSGHFERIFEQTVLESLRSHSGRRVSLLDAGCGHGTWLERVLDFAGVHQIEIDATGVDASERRIAIGRSLLGSHAGVQLICGDLRERKLTQPLDMIYSAEVFQHLSDVQQAELLRCWWSVLKPGGLVIVIDKDRMSLHSMKAELQKRTGRIGRRLLGVFPDEYASLFAGIRYPSFRYLLKVAKTIGFGFRPLVRAGSFTALTLAKPAIS